MATRVPNLLRVGERGELAAGVRLLGVRELLPARLAGSHLVALADQGAWVRILPRPAVRPGRLARLGARGLSIGDRGLVAVVGRQVVAAVDELIGQVLLIDVGTLELVRVPVADADPVVLHAAVARVPEM